MADYSDIQRALGRISANFNVFGRDQWIQDNCRAWHDEMVNVMPTDLERAVSRCIRDDEKPPTLKRFLKHLKAGGVNKRQLPDGCDDCRGTGMRMAVWHRYMYDKEGAINHDKPDAYTCALRCDCERGNAISCELNEHTKIKTRPWKEAIAEWERSPRTIRIVLTSRDYPALWPVDGYTDAQWARLKGLGGTKQEASLYARSVVAGAQLEER